MIDSVNAQHNFECSSYSLDVKPYSVVVMCLYLLLDAACVEYYLILYRHQSVTGAQTSV